MKLTFWNKIVFALGISGSAILAFVLVSGCAVRTDGRAGLQSGVVATPSPAQVEVAGVPDDYVWDGYEYVGIVGDQYYYLGPGAVWLACDPIRIERFHIWAGRHPDWQAHTIRNDRYRKDAHGHEYPKALGQTK